MNCFGSPFLNVIRVQECDFKGICRIYFGSEMLQHRTPQRITVVELTVVLF